jgi:ankyrin repeat protein
VLLAATNPLAGEITRAIKTGDLEGVGRLLAQHPGLAAARIAGREPGRSRTVLHQAADWPGFFPDAPAIVRLLVGAGAEVNAPTEGPASETPLHWAASSDDVDVAETLIDLGADLEAPGASIAGGPPLDDAVGYACWQVAHLLVRRGAHVDRLWHASALGLLVRLRELLEIDAPTQAQINQAFWHACHGGQRRTAELLLARGADINFVPEYAKDTPLRAATAVETRRETLAAWLRQRRTPMTFE